MKTPDWVVAAGIVVGLVLVFYAPILTAVLASAFIVQDCVRDAREVAEPWSDDHRAVWPFAAGAPE